MNVMRGEARQESGQPLFRIRSGHDDLIATGVRREAPKGDAATLSARAQAFMDALTDGPRCLVGAFPYDRREPDYLIQPVRLERGVRNAGHGAPASALFSQQLCAVEARPTGARYVDAVTRCLAMLSNEAQPLRKVVLSRSLALTATGAVDPSRLFALLGQDSSVTIFMAPLPKRSAAPRALVGATPELLVRKSGAAVVSHPLAGSSRRWADEEQDRRSAAALARSEKDQREHATVVEAVMDMLAPYCRELGAPDGVQLRATASMWHLGTRIVGTLKDRGTPVVELAAALHPTPAVCGLPREAAESVIRDLEGYDRGFYAGAVGWMDGEGDGDWHVAIRCAEIDGPALTLYAGAGIVAGSDPMVELDETSAKFSALLNALGIDEQGRPLRNSVA